MLLALGREKRRESVPALKAFPGLMRTCSTGAFLQQGIRAFKSSCLSLPSPLAVVNHIVYLRSYKPDVCQHLTVTHLCVNTMQWRENHLCPLACLPHEQDKGTEHVESSSFIVSLAEFHSHGCCWGLISALPSLIESVVIRNKEKCRRRVSHLSLKPQGKD